MREGETAGAGNLSTRAGTVSRAFTVAGAEHGTGETVTRASRLGELHFARLPGAAVEARAVAPLLGDDTVTLLADAALERALRERLRTATPRVLHLATHGFFLPPPPEVAGRAGEGAVPENPLARSGLALAGANPAVRGEGLEGVLTAEKVLSLPLLGTELVVLSACETGRGDPRDGEGVFGLRRAFGQAGAKGLVMSLWPVPDAETAELMTTFHEGRREGLDSARALRRAALRQRELLLRATGQDNPAAWGGFIFAGER